MIGRIFTADHHVYDLPPLLRWNVRHTGTVPCDSWSVTAVYQPEMLPVLRMAAGFAAIENGTTQLRGIVDEYTVELGGGGMTVTLSGRKYRPRPAAFPLELPPACRRRRTVPLRRVRP